MSDVSQVYYWECQPQKGGECPAPVKVLPANPIPGGAAVGIPWLRVGLHRDHEANFWLRERQEHGVARAIAKAMKADHDPQWVCQDGCHDWADGRRSLPRLRSILQERSGQP